MHNVVKWPNIMHERVKLTYDMKDLTYFLTCEVNIMLFFLLGSWRGFGVSLNIHINVIAPFGATLREEASNKLRGIGYFWK